MLIKLLLKMWPALVPIILYIIWAFVFKKNFKKSSQAKSGVKIIDSEFDEDNDQKDQKTKKTGSNSDFSLKDPKFIAVVYLSLITAIICFLIFAISSNSRKHDDHSSSRIEYQ